MPRRFSNNDDCQGKPSLFLDVVERAFPEKTIAVIVRQTAFYSLVETPLACWEFAKATVISMMIVREI